jgi:hypothetical protein
MENQMSYSIKNGKVVRKQHDQGSVNRFCRTIQDMTLPISEQEALTLMTSGAGHVAHMMCAHDDWCSTMQTGNGSDCNCNPRVTFRRHPHQMDKH